MATIDALLEEATSVVAPVDRPSSAGPSSRLWLAPPSPNPFRPGTSLVYRLGERSPVRLGVYDPAGRLVRILTDDSREPGEHVISWDGRTSDGRRASSGVYFLLLEGAGERRTRRVVLVR